MPLARMAITAAADIPSLAVLYKLGKLSPPAATSASLHRPSPNASFNARVCTLRGDITKLAVDAVVNAANRHLQGGGGVDGAIHAAAGPDLYDECNALGGCDTGSAKITEGYEMPARKIIHAVGPIFHLLERAEAKRLLEGCYRTSLDLAVKNGCRSVAFSSISTGVYGYPSGEAARVAAGVAREFLEGDDGDGIDQIVFCTFEPKDVQAYEEALPQFFPPKEEADQADSGDEAQAQAVADKLPSVPKSDPPAA